MAVIRDAEFRHLKTVLRLGVGDKVSLFNGRGLELIGEIESMAKAEAAVKVLGVKNTEGVESAVKITLLQGLVKGGKPEIILQKATELGAAEVVFFTTGRTVPRPAGDSEKRLLRFRRIALEAVKQCGRTVVPEVGIVSFEEAIKVRGEELLLVFNKVEGSISVEDAMGGFGGDSIAVMVGPEGGFTDEEAEAAREAGFKAISLGRRTLRSETAAVAALSIVHSAVGGLK